MDVSQTIFALASAQGRAGVAVFRISGPQAERAFELLAPDVPPPEARKAVLRKLYHPGKHMPSEAFSPRVPLDQALILWFPAPHSFTGENIVEIQTHGGKAIINAVSDALTLLGMRLAEPGEFTRRAFENGRLDLTEAEAVADLVHAETEAQRRQAMRQFEGELGKLYENWHERLLRSLAYLEAAIDFSDEELPPDLFEKQTKNLRVLSDEMDRHLNDSHRGERLRDGFLIAILGPPNAGKSSLLNVLARRDAAIVSSVAGTTRDVIEVHLDLAGWPVTLADTAGLRESDEQIEGEGIRRALVRAEKADIKLLVLDGASWPTADAASQNLIDDRALIVVNKSDLIDNAGSPDTSQINWKGQLWQTLFISVQTGAGIQTLLLRLTQLIEEKFGDKGALPLTRARHRDAIEESRACLTRALSASEAELRCEDVRLAMRSLGRITGRVDVEDLLDVIFRDFCIGK